MRLFKLEKRSYKFSLLYLVVIVLLFGCKETDLQEIKKARQELNDLGYGFSQQEFQFVVLNNDLTAINLFITSGFKPEDRIILNFVDDITPSTMEDILSNFEYGELDGNKIYYIGTSRFEEHFLEKTGQFNDYDMLEVFWDKGVRLPKYPYKLVKDAISSGRIETLQFLKDKNFDFSEQLYDGDNVDDQINYLLPIVESLEDGFFRDINYDVVEFILKSGGTLNGWNATTEDGSEKSLNEIYSEQIESDEKLSELFDLYHD